MHHDKVLSTFENFDTHLFLARLMRMEIRIGIESHPFFLAHLILTIHLFPFSYPTMWVSICRLVLS